MLTAPHRFRLLWKRVVAALSLIAAAVLAPVPAPVSGAGVSGSRAGNGAALTNAASSLMANVGALIGGGQQKLAPDASGDAQAKAYIPPARQEMALLRPEAAFAPADADEPFPTHAARSGLTRAPPAA